MRATVDAIVRVIAALAIGLLLSGCVHITVTLPGTRPITNVPSQTAQPPSANATGQSPTTPETTQRSGATEPSPARTAEEGPVAVHVPQPGSVERKAILDKARVPVEQRLRQPVVFKIEHFEVEDGWAFVYGIPLKPNGAPVDLSVTPYAAAAKHGAFGDDFNALLRYQNGSWSVMTYNVGATDVPWVNWAETYGAPAAIFPRG